MSCHPRVTEWTMIIQAHLPHLSKAQATVLALWSLGMVLARSCALTAVSAFLATWLGRKEPAVYQQLREFCYEAAAKRGPSRCALAVEPCFVPLLGWVVAQWGGHAVGPGPRCDDLGHTLYCLGPQRGLSGLRHPGGLDRLGGHGQTCLAPGMVAHAAPGAPSRPTRLDGPGAGRSGLVRPLAVSAHHPAGLAPLFAHQHRGHLPAHGPGAGRAPADVGAAAGHDMAGDRHRLQRPPPPAPLYAAGLLGSGL